MPKTRLATARYEVLDRCFSDQTRYYFIEDLHRAVNQELESKGLRTVCKRTVQKDIEDMRCDRNWEVDFIEPALINGRRYYRYADPDYSIWRRDLNEHQLSQLKSMLLMLQQFHGLPQFERVEELMRNLEEHYQITLENTANVIAFDTNDYVDGVEYLSLLFEAIVNKQPLKITYHPFHKTDPDTAIVSPYYIKQYNNRWFLFGVTTKNSRLSNMALDRIEAIEFSDEAYIPNMEYDFDEYFEDMIGVSVESDSKVEKIRLRFSENRLPYVLSKPIHGSQRHLHDEDANIELTLATNKEFYQQIFSFGNDVEILSPLKVRQKMAEKVAELNKLYKK